MLVKLLKWLNVANEALGLPFVNTAGVVEIPNDVVLTGPDSDLELPNGEKLVFVMSDGITRTSAVTVDGSDVLFIGESGFGGSSKTVVTCVSGGITQILAGVNGIQIDDGAAKLITMSIDMNFGTQARHLKSSAQWTYASGSITGGANPAWDYEDGFGATITRNGAGDYSVTFTAAFGNTNYAPICTVQADNYRVSIVNKASAGFDIKLYNASDVAADADIGVVVFGQSQ